MVQYVLWRHIKKYKNIYEHYLVINVVHENNVKIITLKEQDKFLFKAS
jgi:hypothetical protein